MACKQRTLTAAMAVSREEEKMSATIGTRMKQRAAALEAKEKQTELVQARIDQATGEKGGCLRQRCSSSDIGAA